jgi:hypothetical protein
MKKLNISRYDLVNYAKILILGLLYAALLTWVAAGAPPNAPSNPSPANGATGVSVDTALSWSCTDPDGDDVLYSIRLYRDGRNYGYSEFAVVNQSAASYTPFVLFYNSVYHWQITAIDNHSEVMEGDWWNFTTGTYTIADEDYDAAYQQTFDTTNSTFSFTRIYEGVQTVYNTVIPAGIFYLFMFSLIFGGIWIKQGDVTIPAILGLILAPSLWYYIPLEYQYACYWLFVVSIGGLIASIFKARQ